MIICISKYFYIVIVHSVLYQFIAIFQGELSIFPITVKNTLKPLLYYLIVFFPGIVVLPATGAVGLALMLGGAVCPIAALLKLIGGLFGFDVPISLFDIGSFQLPLAVGFPLAVILGLLLLFAGIYLWKLTRKYIAWITILKRNMPGQQEKTMKVTCEQKPIGQSEQEAAETVSTMITTGILKTEGQL